MQIGKDMAIPLVMLVTEGPIKPGELICYEYGECYPTGKFGVNLRLQPKQWLDLEANAAAAQ